MSKTIKKTITIFTVLCAALLIVFCVELLLINRGRDDAGTTMIRTPSTESPQSNPTANQVVPPVETIPASNVNTPDGTETENIGSRYELNMASDVQLILYSDEEHFEFTDMDPVWIFDHVDSEARLEVSLRYLPQQAEVYAASFLDGYLDGETSVVRGERQVARSNLRGVYVTGISETETYAAWIIPIDTGDDDNLGVAIMMVYRNEVLRDELLGIVDTIEMTASNTTPENPVDRTDTDDEEDDFD